MNLGAVTCESAVDKKDAEFDSVTSHLQMYLSKTLHRAFPTGIPGVKGGGVETVGQNDSERYAKQFFRVYDRYLNDYLSIEFTLTESLNFDASAKVTEGYCEEDMNVIVERAKAAWEWQRDGSRKAEISLHNMLQRIAYIIGAPKGFGEKAPNRRTADYSYKAMGKGGRVRVINAVAKGEYTIYYRSGVANLAVHLPILLDDASEYLLAKFYIDLERNAKINLVWHVGASMLVQQLIEKVPQHTFRQALALRPSYHYDVPFCDFVLAEYPDVIVLRAMSDGYQFFRDGQFVTGVQNVEELVAAPLEEEIVAKYPQQLWHHGTGILFTSGELQDTEVDGKRHVKFVPYKLG